VDRLHAQATHVHDLVVDAEAAVAAYLDVEIELVANRTSGGGSSATTSPREPAGALIGHHAAGAEFVSELSLTRREHEVLELLAAGATNSQIAERLFITEGTAKSHVGRILRKLGAGNRVEAASMFLRSQTQSSPHTRREE
jgi:DNA-binding CsgD family transcriptional regulator